MRVLLVALLLMALSTAHGADGVPVTIVNYSDLPVYAHAVELDLDGMALT